MLRFQSSLRQALLEMCAARASHAANRIWGTVGTGLRSVKVVFLVATLALTTQAVANESIVRCANLVYGHGKTSVCFSAEFLRQVARDSHVRTDPQLYTVALEDPELYQFPFAIMTGEGAFELTPGQREALRNYLRQGGFVVASAGCSNPSWTQSFRREMQLVFGELSLKRLESTHPIFHSLYQIGNLDLGKSSGEGHLEGLEIDGKIVLVFSSDGLNDSSQVSENCCCCGGNEIRNARLVNCNLLAYTLTH